MSKKVWFLAVLLLIVPLIVTACGSKKSNKNTVELKQTFASTIGITLKYPEGWLARDHNGNIEIGNNQQGLDNAQYALRARLTTGTFAMGINANNEGLPGELFSQPVPEALKSMMAPLPSDIKVGDIKAITVAGKEAARVNVAYESNKTEAVAILIKWDAANFIVLFGLAYQGELSQYDAAIQQIAASITYQVPLTPTPMPAPTQGS